MILLHLSFVILSMIFRVCHWNECVHEMRLYLEIMTTTKNCSCIYMTVTMAANMHPNRKWFYDLFLLPSVFKCLCFDSLSFGYLSPHFKHQNHSSAKTIETFRSFWFVCVSSFLSQMVEHSNHTRYNLPMIVLVFILNEIGHFFIKIKLKRLLIEIDSIEHNCSVLALLMQLSFHTNE